MARHVHLDPVGGVAGDMFVAAMLDAFPQYRQVCWQDIESAGLLKHVDVKLVSVTTKGLAAKQFQVALQETPAERTGRYADLRQWLEQGSLASVVKGRALSILHLLAVAEAHVHAVPVDDVHFHEIADWDSLVDVVAAASLIERSAIESWSCAALPLGSGRVKTEHGDLPVPAPATLQLLHGFAVWDDGDAGERVTPTGAAIVKHLFTSAEGRSMSMDKRVSGTVSAIGCGAGQRQLQQHPNMLRVLVTDHRISQTVDADKEQDEILQVTCDIDDMTPEELAVSLEHIRACVGVVDACYQLGIGKKGRATFHVVVLSQAAFEPQVCACIFHETTTIGMRVDKVRRRVLKRKIHSFTDDIGPARIKVAERLGVKTAKVDSDDLAEQKGLQARRLRARQLMGQFES